MKTIVGCSRAFVQQMSMAAIESFLLGTGEAQSDDESAREVSGMVWGSENIIDLDTSEPLRFVQFDQLFVNLSSERTLSSVSDHENFVRLCYNTIATISPHLRPLAHFHTHPYTREEATAQDVIENELYKFSRADYNLFKSGSDDIWEVTEDRPIFCVATICDNRRLGAVSGKPVGENGVYFDIGQYRIWFYVERGVLSGPDSDTRKTTAKNVNLLPMDFAIRGSWRIKLP